MFQPIFCCRCEVLGAATATDVLLLPFYSLLPPTPSPIKGEGEPPHWAHRRAPHTPAYNHRGEGMGGRDVACNVSTNGPTHKRQGGKSRCGGSPSPLNGSVGRGSGGNIRGGGSEKIPLVMHPYCRPYIVPFINPLGIIHC